MALLGTKYTTTSNDWSNTDTFVDFITNHFAKYAKTPCVLTPRRHVFLSTMDTTHVNMVISEAKKLNIHIFVLPPHTSHVTQPMDVSIFGHMKIFFSISKPIPPTSLDINFPIIVTCYNKALSSQNLMSIFNQCYCPI